MEGFVSVANTCNGYCEIDVQIFAAALGELIVEASAEAKAWVCFLATQAWLNTDRCADAGMQLPCVGKYAEKNESVQVEGKARAGEHFSASQHTFVEDIKQDTKRVFVAFFAGLFIDEEGSCTLEIGTGALVGESGAQCIARLSATPIREDVHVIAEAAAEISVFACSEGSSAEAAAAAGGQAEAVVTAQALARAIATAALACEATGDAEACVFARSYAETQAIAIAEAFAHATAVAVGGECDCDITDATSIHVMTEHIILASAEIYREACAYNSHTSVDDTVDRHKRAFAEALAFAAAEAVAGSECKAAAASLGSATTVTIEHPNDGDEGNEGNEGDEGHVPRDHPNDGNEGNEGNEGDEGKAPRDHPNDGNEGNEGNEGDEGKAPRDHPNDGNEGNEGNEGDEGKAPRDHPNDGNEGNEGNEGDEGKAPRDHPNDGNEGNEGNEGADNTPVGKTAAGGRCAGTVAHEEKCKVGDKVYACEAGRIDCVKVSENHGGVFRCKDIRVARWAQAERLACTA